LQKYLVTVKSTYLEELVIHNVMKLVYKVCMPFQWCPLLQMIIQITCCFIVSKVWQRLNVKSCELFFPKKFYKIGPLLSSSFLSQVTFMSKCWKCRNSNYFLVIFFKNRWRYNFGQFFQIFFAKKSLNIKPILHNRPHLNEASFNESYISVPLINCHIN